MTLNVSKYHGAGNDFILTEDTSLSSFQIKSFCRRSYGIGADGLITVSRLDNDDPADIRMIIYNADGTRPEMCANGLRCASRYWIEEKLDTDVDTLTVRTDAGIRQVSVVDKNSSKWRVKTESPTPERVEPEVSVACEGKSFHLSYIQLGNPHAVFFGQEFGRDEIRNIGEYLNGNDSPFSEGANLFYGDVLDGQIEGIVYERGVGFTEACGTGAVAAAVAAGQRGRINRDRVDVKLPGGTLTVLFQEESIGLIGPVFKVFTGATVSAF